jgi:hypothetical protein
MFKIATRLSLVALALTGCSDHGASTKMQDDSAATCACPLDWQIDNLAVCVSAHTAFTSTLVYSSYLTDEKITCDTAKGFPQPAPARTWSGQRISSPCIGGGTLRLRVRQGHSESASENDCVLAEQAIDFDYPVAEATLELAALSGWSVQDQDCARAYEEQGGYLEFIIESEQLGCGSEEAKVRYVDICPLRCDTDPNGSDCDKCGSGSLVNQL